MNLVKKYLPLLFVLVIFNSCAVILNFQDLPDTKGEYIIGTDVFMWEDTYRDEWFTKDKIDTRKIVVQIWYPASEKSDSLYPYMDNANLRIESIAKRIDKNPAQVALRWVMERPGITSAIVGARNVDQLLDNLDSTGWKLDSELSETLTKISQPDPRYPQSMEKGMVDRRAEAVK